MKQSHLTLLLVVVFVALGALAISRRRKEGLIGGFMPPRGPGIPGTAPPNPARPFTTVVVSATHGDVAKASEKFLIKRGQAVEMQRDAYEKLSFAFRVWKTENAGTLGKGQQMYQKFIRDYLLKFPMMMRAFKEMLAAVEYRIKMNGMVLPVQMKTEPGLRFMVSLAKAFHAMSWTFELNVWR